MDRVYVMHMFRVDSVDTSNSKPIRTKWRSLSNIYSEFMGLIDGCGILTQYYILWVGLETAVLKHPT